MRLPRLPLKGEVNTPFVVATWNVGGLSAANALEMLQAIGGNKAVSSVQVFLFQEIVPDAGKFFAHNREWKLAFGKQEGEWRGEGWPSAGTQQHTPIHKSWPGGWRWCFAPRRGRKWGALSAHVPHHATTARTEALLSEWGG